jgi:AcrR family transcriptional regulator
MRLPADQRRQQLLDVAREVFAGTGFHETSMDDIAEAAGVTKPVLYQHFPSKRALYLELLNDTGRQLLESLAAATHRVPTGRERVEAGFRAYFRFVLDSRGGFRLLFGAAVRTDSEFAEIVDGVVRAAADVISELIEIPASTEHRRVLASALVGMAESVGRSATDGVDRAGEVTDPERLASWIAELAWFGLRGVRSVEPSQLP